MVDIDDAERDDRSKLMPSSHSGFVGTVTRAISQLFLVICPATWFLAAAALILRRYLPRRRMEQIIIAAVIVVELLIVGNVKLGDRYLTTITPLAQLWGGMGMMAIAEFARRRSLASPGAPAEGAMGARTQGALPPRVIGVMGHSAIAQSVLLAILVAGLGFWSLFSINTGLRHSELRDIGRGILTRAGGGSVIMSASMEPVFYARGHGVVVVTANSAKAVLSRQALQESCMANGVDYVVVDSHETWCPWLMRALQKDGFGDLAVVERRQTQLPTWRRTPAEAVPRFTYLVSGRRLWLYEFSVQDSLLLYRLPMWGHDAAMPAAVTCHSGGSGAPGRP